MKESTQMRLYQKSRMKQENKVNVDFDKLLTKLKDTN